LSLWKLAENCAAAQFSEPVSAGEKSRRRNRSKAPEYAIGTVPVKPTAVRTLRGQLVRVDAESRQVTVRTNSEQISAAFAQPAGLEDISASSKVRKKFGEHKLDLAGLRPGWTVKVRYYESLTLVSELVVTGM